MTTIAQPSTTFVTGDPKNFKFTFTVDGTAIATSTEVKVAITSLNQDEVIVDPKTAAWSGDDSCWIAAFTGGDTASLLSDSDDLTSTLKHPKCMIEIQAGSPYYATQKFVASVGKGLVA